MKRLLLLAFAALFFSAFPTTAQSEELQACASAQRQDKAQVQEVESEYVLRCSPSLRQADVPVREIESVAQIPAIALEKVPFKDKEALLEELAGLYHIYIYQFSRKTLEDSLRIIPDLYYENKDVVSVMINSIHKVLIPELFDKYKPGNYNSAYNPFEVIEQLEDSKTEEEFLERAAAIGQEKDKNFALLSARYKAAFKAVDDVFAQVERSLPKRPYLSREREDALLENYENLRCLTSEEWDIFKKEIIFSLIKANAPEIIESLKPYISVLFDNIFTNSPRQEKVARDAINSLIRINRKELDKTIKEALAAFYKTKRIYGADRSKNGF
jgi:hypothetical protein